MMRSVSRVWRSADNGVGMTSRTPDVSQWGSEHPLSALKTESSPDSDMNQHGKEAELDEDYKP